MGKLQAFRVEFDRPNATYAPGETVTGKVILILSGPKNMREIRLQALGKADVYWTEESSSTDMDGNSTSSSTSYSKSETYFDKTIVFASPKSGESSAEIPPGTHVYPFSFDIPLNVPCSFEHSIGHIRYTACAIIDRPWRFNHKALSAITVIADYDLNAHPDLTIGINDEINREFHSHLCFGNSGSFNAVVKSRVKGFVPGEMIQLDVSYDNRSSSVNVKQMRLCFHQMLTFHATGGKYRSSKNVRNIAVGSPFPKMGEQSLYIKVPSVPPSNLEHCSIIDISYQVELRIHTTGMHRKISQHYPIVIGTIPLYNREPILTQPSAPPNDQVTDSDIESLPPNQQEDVLQPIDFVDMSLPHYPGEIPPPLYEECFNGSKLIGDPNEEGMVESNLQYAPKYPVYKFPIPMSYSSQEVAKSEKSAKTCSIT